MKTSTRILLGLPLESACKTCYGNGWVQDGIAGELRKRCPDCSTPCAECGGKRVIDSGGFSPWGTPIDTPCPSCELEKLKELAEIGAAWRKSSSLERRFPQSSKALADATDKIIETEMRCSLLIGIVETMTDFVKTVSAQTPEKPDYWCSCGQCERNSDEAKKLLKFCGETA